MISVHPNKTRETGQGNQLNRQKYAYNTKYYLYRNITFDFRNITLDYHTTEV